MDRVQYQPAPEHIQQGRLEMQMDRMQRIALRAEQLGLIQQGCALCAELEGLLAAYQGIIDDGKSPSRKCALQTLRKIQEGLRGWDGALQGLLGGSDEALIAENGRIRNEIQRIRRIIRGKAALLQTLKTQLRNYHLQCLNEAFAQIEAETPAGEGALEKQRRNQRLRDRRRALEFENAYRRIKNGMRDLRRRADIANYADDAFDRIDRALDQLRANDPDPSAIDALEQRDVQPLADRLRKFEREARALDDQLSHRLAVYDALCEETGLRPVDAFSFRRESIREIDAACNQLINTIGLRRGMEVDGNRAAQVLSYERYRNRRMKYR